MNKIKGSSSAVKMKYLLFVFAAAVLVSLPTRVYQLLALVDPTNGFYKESDVTIPVLYGVVAVFGVLFLVLSFVSKEVPSPKLPTGKNPVLGIASFVMVAGLGTDMFSILSKIIPANQMNAGIFISLLRSNLSKSGGAFTILEFIFAFFAIIYFIVFGISHLNGKASYKEFKLLALAPLCWSMTVLVTKLMNAISFIKVSELLFEIFMFVFVMLFFLTFARISSGVFTEDSMWGIYGYGLVASLLAAIVTIPRIVIALVGLDAVEGNEFNFAHITVLAFILAYIFASLGVGFKDGMKNRREISEIDLPDENVVVKKDDVGEFFEEDEEENIGNTAEETIEPLASFEETIQENSEETSEVVFEEELLAISEVVVEETAEEIIEEVIEETTEEATEEAVEEAVEETVIEEAQKVAEDEIVTESEEHSEEVSEEAVIPDFELFEEQIFEADTKAEDTSVPERDTKEKKLGNLFKKSVKAEVKESEETEEEEDGLKPISLADLKKKNNKE